LTERALRDSRKFSFYQLVRLLLRAQPEALPPGGAGPARRENLRFRPAASLAFAASDVESVEVVKSGADSPPRFRIVVNFMGLYGPASPLPTHFTEDILWSGGDGDGARDFIDLFNHRLISLLYRAWQKYRYPVQFDPGGGDAMTPRALCVIGMGTRGMEEGAGVPLVPLLAAAGLLAARQRSAVGLEGLLRVHLGEVGVRIEACVERWVALPESQLMCLGRSGSRLGEDTVVGSRARDRGSSFRIVLGPLTAAQFRGLLPRNETFGHLVRLVRLYLRDPLDFDMTLGLRATEVPALVLSASADLPLGQMSWLTPRGTEEGVAILSISAHDPLTRRRVPLKPAAPAPSVSGVPPRVQPRPAPVTTRPTRR
jgi:type VI secretion system protein ImpH